MFMQGNGSLYVFRKLTRELLTQLSVNVYVIVPLYVATHFRQQTFDRYDCSFRCSASYWGVCNKLEFNK